MADDSAVDRALVACKCCRLLVRCVKTEGSPIFAQYRRGDDRVAAIEASIASDRWIPACYDCKCLQRKGTKPTIFTYSALLLLPPRHGASADRSPRAFNARVAIPERCASRL